MQEGQYTPIHNAHDEFRRLKEPIHTATALANAMRMIASHGIETEKGLGSDDLTSLLQVNYDLIDAIGEVYDAYENCFSGLNAGGAE